MKKPCLLVALFLIGGPISRLGLEAESLMAVREKTEPAENCREKRSILRSLRVEGPRIDPDGACRMVFYPP